MKTVIQTVAIVALVAVGSVANAAGERLLAHEFAKTAIVASMKSPTTAKVCPWGDLKTHSVADIFRGDDPVEATAVTGWIDATNSFGAFIRESWEVIVVDGEIAACKIGDNRRKMADGYVFGFRHTPGQIKKAEENRRLAITMAPVVADAKQLAANHARALGARVSTLTKKQAEARAKSLVTVGLRRVQATGVDAKNAWIEAYVGEILSH